jgi:hypothetical protein
MGGRIYLFFLFVGKVIGGGWWVAASVRRRCAAFGQLVIYLVA